MLDVVIFVKDADDVLRVVGFFVGVLVIGFCVVGFFVGRELEPENT